MFKEILVTPIIKFWPILAVAAGGVWNAANLSADVAENTKDVASIGAQFKAHEGDAIDRLARIETKIDTIMEAK